MLAAARKSLILFTSRSKIPAVILLLCIAAVALLEMLSIGLVIPLIQSSTIGPDQTGVSAQFTQALSWFGLGTEPFTIAALFASVFVIKNLAILFLSYAIARTVALQSAQARKTLFNIYLRHPLEYHANRNSAELLRNIMTGCGQTFEAVRLLFILSLEFLLSVAALSLLLLIEPKMTLVIGGVLIVGSVLFYGLTSRHFRYWGQKSLELEGAEIKWINEALGGIRLVKVYGVIAGFTEHLYGFARNRALYESRAMTAILLPRLYLETLAIIGFVIVVGYALALGKPMSELVAMVGVFALAAFRLLPSLNRVLTGTAEIRKRSPHIELIYNDLLQQTEVSRPGVSNREDTITFSREIELKNVSFTYKDASRPALNGVDLVIQQGESIGIVGPSGAGKSTLVDVIIGLVRPNNGHMLIDRRDVDDLIEPWQKHIGYVPQDIYLLDDTLARNIAFSIGDETPDLDRVRKAISMAQLDNLIVTLPDGLNTMLGERGARLSGGQRQRIAIARALYGRPDVLVFDEATAALDNESENEVTLAIRDLSGKKTLLIIAHRLSTVRGCDRIVLMGDGRICDIGKFDELYTRSEDFRHLVELGDLGAAPGGRSSV